MTNTHLIIGGISSGKTQVALDMANGLDIPKIYVATTNNTDNDPEMQAKIIAHQRQRGTDWQTVESPLHIADTIYRIQTPSVCIIDCITMWVSNIMWHHEKKQPRQDIWRCIHTYLTPVTEMISTTPHTLIFISCEVGYAPVHDNTVVRHFQRYQGQVNQAVAKSVNNVYLVTAGIATQIKPII